MNERYESDSIGTLRVPDEAYYGVQSLRANENFRISGLPLHRNFICNLAKIKKAAAITNRDGGELTEETAAVIIQACDEIILGKWHEEFIVDAIQGGAGTSANMNANEVIANRAIELFGGTKGDYRVIHPNDHVNMAQSTNDVIPTAGKMTVIELLDHLLTELRSLYEALMQKSEEFNSVLKIGRTQLQDAVPMRLGQSFHSYATAISRDISHISLERETVNEINIGGTAIGTAINANPYYSKHMTETLCAVSNMKLTAAADLFDSTENLDCFVRVSGTLKACAVNLSKMCNDLRLLSSGPATGFCEINLPAKQNGSSIMPGKVNPVIPEVVSQVAFQVIGNDVTITMAAEAGQLELNAFEPVLFKNLFESLDCMAAAVRTLTVNCIAGITANRELSEQRVRNSSCLATALCPIVGYKKAAEIAKEAMKTGKAVRDLALEAGCMEEELDVVLDLYRMTGVWRPSELESLKRGGV